MQNRTSLVTAERHKLCSVMLQYDGIGNTLCDNDGTFDLKPTSVLSLWDDFTELDDESVCGLCALGARGICGWQRERR